LNRVLRIALSLAGAFFTYVKIGWWGLILPQVSRHLVVAQAIVHGDEGVLLAVRGDLRGWELPGGQVEEGETAEAAVCREVWEETGLIVEVDVHVGDYERHGFRPHTAKLYRCHQTGGALQTNWETLDLRWFPLNALPDTLFPWFRDPLRDAFAESDALPVSRRDYQGMAAVLAAIRIDWRMRMSDNRAR
jgi:8-oxo-dGTP pyrophosphatase MutT (NUDIX family)